MIIVDDKTQQPWGYCLHGDAIPGAAAISMSVVSALLASLLALAYAGRLDNACPSKLRKFRYCPAPRTDTVFGIERESFGAGAACLVVLLFAASVMPLVNDDGHGGGIVAALHATEASYTAFLALHVVCMLVVLGVGTWLLWARWIRARALAIGTDAGTGITMAGVAVKNLGAEDDSEENTNLVTNLVVPAPKNAAGL